MNSRQKQLTVIICISVILFAGFSTSFWLMVSQTDAHYTCEESKFYIKQNGVYIGNHTVWYRTLKNASQSCYLDNIVNQNINNSVVVYVNDFHTCDVEKTVCPPRPILLLVLVLVFFSVSTLLPLLANIYTKRSQRNQQRQYTQLEDIHVAD